MTSNAEYTGLDKFLKDVFENEVKISRKRNGNEIGDIKDAVREIVEDVLFKAFKDDNVFHIPREEISEHLLKVGGVAEESKICDLDEFDFTFILPHFNDRTVKVLDRENARILNIPAFRQIKYQGPKAIKRKLLKRRLLAKIRSEVYLSALHIKKWFTKRLRAIHDHWSERKQLEIRKSTGTLSVYKDDARENGPALNLFFVWKNDNDQQHNCKGLQISVDIAPSIMSKDESLFRDLIADDEYKEQALQIGFCNLIPVKMDLQLNTIFWMELYMHFRPYVLESNEDFLFRCTFSISFVQAEKEIMKKMQNEQSEWFKCYQLLKFFSEKHAMYLYCEKAFGDPKYDRIFSKQKQILTFSSYVLKTMLLRKRSETSQLDQDSDDIASKFMIVYDEMMDILERYYDRPLEVGHACVPSLWIEDFSAMHTFIPQISENEREREADIQQKQIERQLFRLNTIKQLLLQINGDVNYSYEKYRDILMKECLELHTDRMFTPEELGQ